MNKYEQRAKEERKSALRSSMSIWTAGVALIVVVLAILALNSSASPRYFSKPAIIVAILLVVLRQVSRRLKGKHRRAAQPDPQSRLKLD
jgi:L-asparagine transporter-like permease